MSPPLAAQCAYLDATFGRCTLRSHVNGQHVFFGQTISLMPTRMVIDTTLIDRVEVIGMDGRLFAKRDTHINLSIQDDGKTLKVFLQDDESTTPAT